MHPAVTDRFCPRGEQPVQLADVRDVPSAALAGVAGDLGEELLADGEKQPLDFPRPRGRPGVEWVSLTPSTAQARSSHASTKAEPLST